MNKLEAEDDDFQKVVAVSRVNFHENLRNTDEAAIVKARAEYGTKVTGLVLADTGGAAMDSTVEVMPLKLTVSFFW